MTIAVAGLNLPARSQVTLKFEITADVNVTAFVARQKVNHYLIMHVGNLLHAGTPELVAAESFFWRVPVLLTTREKGRLGKVGELLVNVESGEVVIESPEQLEEMEAHAERLYQRAASVAGKR